MPRTKRQTDLKGLEFAERLAFGLESSGNPSDMALAAEIRVQALSDLMESQFLAATWPSIRAAEKIKPDGDNTSVISRNLCLDKTNKC